VVSPSAAPDRLLPGGDSGHISFGGIVQPPAPGVVAATIGAVGAASLRAPDPARARPHPAPCGRRPRARSPARAMRGVLSHAAPPAACPWSGCVRMRAATGRRAPWSSQLRHLASGGARRAVPAPAGPAGQPRQPLTRAGGAQAAEEAADAVDWDDAVGISMPLYTLVDVLFELQSRGFFRRQARSKP